MPPQRSAARVKKARPSVVETKRRIAQRRKPKPAYTRLVDAAPPVELKERAPSSATESLSFAQHSRPPPRTHHLDKRAADLLVALGGGSMDDLLTTKEVSLWLNVSTQWIEIGRHKKYGPRYVRLSQRCVRYRRGDVLDWLASRTHSSTREYSKEGGA
jgi:predicted DNA-binding transcriptional regulator AlpA